MNARFKMNSLLQKAFGVLVWLGLAVSVVSAQTRFDLGSLPLWFEAGPGADARMFIAHGRDSQISLSPEGAKFTLGRPGQPPATTRMLFVGASGAAEISGSAAMPARINYFQGNDPAQWQTGLAAFGQVRVTGVYPGIDLVYYGNQQRLEYDFDLAPGARPESVAIRFAGAQKVLVDAHGELVVELAGRQVIQQQPVAYQMIGGVRRSVAVGYKMLDAHTVAFAVGHYDSRQALVIDPVLSYSTFFGGYSTDIAWAVAFATNDNSVYIAGQTLSANINGTLPLTTPGAFQPNFQGGLFYGDAFVAKFHDLTNPTQLNDLATNLVYCTYLGGSQDDAAFALAVDSTGHAFVTGITYSTNFPVTNFLVFPRGNGKIFNGSTNQASYDPTLNSYPSEGFVSELDPNGAHLMFSTYLGGESIDLPQGLALDPAGDIFLTGYTSSTNFPVTTNAWQPELQTVLNRYLGFNAFVTEIGTNGAGGRALTYSSYLGGTNQDMGYGIAFNHGYVAVAGSTCSSNFPTTNAISQYLSGSTYYSGAVLNSSSNNINNNFVSVAYVPLNCDAFVTLYPVTGSTLGAPVYSTFLGGTNTDVAYGVALDAQANVYVVGGTTSTNFPVTSNPGQLVLPSFVLTNNYYGIFVTNVFLTQLKFQGAAPPVIGYSAVFGGFGNDVAQGIALDAAGNAFVVGYTSSITNAFATPNNLLGALSATNSGQINVFVAAFQSGFSNLLYAADFGSYSQDTGYGIAVGPDDSIYVAGQTLSASPFYYLQFPVLNAWEPSVSDQNNAFLVKILPNLAAAPTLAIKLAGSNALVSWSASPLAEFSTNILYLQLNTNLLVDAVFTNYVTNAIPYSFDTMVVTNLITNLVPPSSWVPVTESPMVTHPFTNGYTNSLFQYSFPSTNSMRYFRLQSITY